MFMIKLMDIAILGGDFSYVLFFVFFFFDL